MIRRWFRRSPNVFDDASAFVDGELAPDRHAAFESALAGSHDLQRQVDELRATKQVLASLAEVEVARSFTISVAQAASDVAPSMRRRELAAQGPGGWFGGVFGGAALVRSAAAVSVFASAALVAVIAIDVADDGGGPVGPQLSVASAPQVEDAASAAQAQAAPTALGSRSSEAPVAEAEQAAADVERPADEAVTEAVEAQAAVAALPAEQADAADGGQTTLAAEAPVNDGLDAEDGSAKPPTSQPEGDGTESVAAVAPTEEVIDQDGADLPATGEIEAETSAAEIAEPDATEPPAEDLADEAPIAEAELAEADAGDEVVDESSDSADTEVTRVEAFEAEASADAAPDDMSDAEAESVTTENVAEPTTSPDRATDQVADELPTERETGGPQTESEAQPAALAPEPEEAPNSRDRDSSSHGDRENPAEPERSVSEGADAERSDGPAEAAGAEQGAVGPEAEPVPSLGRSGEADDDTLVRVLEVVLGIAAGLSAVTLVFALRRRA